MYYRVVCILCDVTRQYERIPGLPFLRYLDKILIEKVERGYQS